MKLFSILAIASTSLALVVEWKDRPVVVSVPPYSVLTVEVPCDIQSVVNLDIVETAFPAKIRANAVHIAVKTDPTSVGITCEQDGVVKSYNVFINPSDSGGTTFIKLIDREFERRYRIAKREEVPEKESHLLAHAKSLLVSMLKGKKVFGYRVFHDGEVIREKGLLLKPVVIYVGRLTGAVYRVKNVSPIRKTVSPMNFSGKGVVLVWIEGTEDSDSVDLRPGEEVHVAIVKTSPSVGNGSPNNPPVIPYR